MSLLTGRSISMALVMVRLFLICASSLGFLWFKIAQHRSFKPELGVDYLSAPETLLQEASCSPQTDIWMLGCLVSRAQ